MRPRPLKPVLWVGSSLDDLRACPEAVQDVVGYALFLAQEGGQHPAAKRLKGDLRGIVEVVEDHDRDAQARTGPGQGAAAVGRAGRRHGGGAMKITKSSGNVFADLRLPGAEERLLKAQLASQVARVIADRKLTQSAAATIMGVDQPKVSHLLHGRLAGFSVDRLLTWLTALGRDVDITVRAPVRRRAGRLRVHMLAVG